MKVERFDVGPMGTNLYVCYDDNKKGFIVDCPYESNKVTNFIEENDIDIKFILLTHTHIDHILGLKFYVDKYKVDVYASEDAKDICNDPTYNLTDYFGYDIDQVKIDRYLKDNEKFSKFDILAIKTPGHTIDSISYKIDDFIFVGDTIFRMSIGRSDLKGGSYEDIIASIKDKLIIYDDSTILLPGHGVETNIEFEKQNNPFIN
ncbi:MAG: MBL fold metallo-hydrolase [Tissierellia bacterium]|nr:MBL fold metallo-hydrolase [Tissierellia bacterium]